MTTGRTQTRIDLLGVVHREPRGYQRTRRALEELEPDLVLVELSAFAWAFRTRQRRFLLQAFHRNVRIAADRSAVALGEALRHPQLRAVQRQLLLPYEWRAARRFSAEFGRPVFPVDHSAFSRSWIQSWPELLAPENLLFLLQHSPSDRDPDPYRNVVDALSRLPQRPPSTRPPIRCGKSAWLDRERYLQHQVQAAVSIFHPGRLLYIGGWRHLLWETGEGPTIRTLLLPQQPQIHLLCHFDPSAGRLPAAVVPPGENRIEGEIRMCYRRHPFDREPDVRRLGRARRGVSGAL